MSREKRPATAAVVLRRPSAPITESDVWRALAPMLDLLNVDRDDLRSMHVTPGTVRLDLIPRFRGRPQHDSSVRVTYPIVFDPDAEGDDR